MEAEKSVEGREAVSGEECGLVTLGAWEGAAREGDYSTQGTAGEGQLRGKGTPRQPRRAGRLLTLENVRRRGRREER